MIQSTPQLDTNRPKVSKRDGADMGGKRKRPSESSDEYNAGGGRQTRNSAETSHYFPEVYDVGSFDSLATRRSLRRSGAPSRFQNDSIINIDGEDDGFDRPPTRPKVERPVDHYGEYVTYYDLILD